MDIYVCIDFFAEYSLKSELERLFGKFDISLNFPDKPKMGTEVYLQVPIRLNGKVGIDTISYITSHLKKEYQISCGESFSCRFNYLDFERSPFFRLVSTGNSSKAFLEHKKDGIKWKTICPSCGIQEKVQTSPLVMDTSKVGDRYMVNVGVDYWVVSEKMAYLMKEWEITGYELREVIHSGKKPAQPVFQVIPTNVLPSWSSEMKHYYFITEPEERCQTCNIRGRIDYPYHYNKRDLEQYPIKDINIMKDLKSNGSWAYRPVFLSKRFRDLLIENGITREVINRDDDNYKSRNWLFEPVVIIE